MASHLRHALDPVPDRGLVEVREKTARDQIEETLVVAREIRVGNLSGRDDREVIGDLRVVEGALDVLEPLLAQMCGLGLERASFGEGPQRLVDGWQRERPIERLLPSVTSKQRHF